VKAYIHTICIDDDASTKAYCSPKFEDLDAMNIPRPTNRKGEPKRLKKDDKCQLPKNHPPINFLADLCHQVRTFGKYLWNLKSDGKKKSDITVIDCMRLKRNYAWWLFSGRRLSFEEYEESSKSPVLHHFNDHSTSCGSWCQHRGKSETELEQLGNYRSKTKNATMYLLCMGIIDRFSDKESLRECHHRMHSQKNESMNRSIMRYAPKDKTLCRTMALTARISMSVSIDTLGHAEYYEVLFVAMDFGHTELTSSGLRRMWRKKEYGRIYSRLREVKRRRRRYQRDRMIEGARKMEEDAVAGREYSTGIRLREEDDGMEVSAGEQRGRKQRRTREAHDDKRTRRVSRGECKCGGTDHKRITSSKCPWSQLPKEEVARNYEQRMRTSAEPQNLNCREDMAVGNVPGNQNTGPGSIPTGNPVDVMSTGIPVEVVPLEVACEERESVQSTGE
jgi:hypothetical protein